MLSEDSLSAHSMLPEASWISVPQKGSHGKGMILTTLSSC